MFYQDTFSDVDECMEGTAMCEQQCSNTIGSYTCSCGEGFIIDENGYVCDGEIKHCLYLATSRTSATIATLQLNG